MDEQILADLARHLEPELQDAAERIERCLHDEKFQDMCSEYEDGVNCLRRLSEVHHERIDEYLALIEDLQREILLYLQEQ
jgi:hypothetical protein